MSILLAVLAGHVLLNGIMTGWDEGMQRMWQDLVIAVVAISVIALGFHHVVRWAVYDWFRKFGSAFLELVRGMPVLLAFVFFFAVNEELWKVATSSRATVIFTIGSSALLLLTAVYLFIEAWEEVRDMQEQDRKWTVIRERLAEIDPWRENATLQMLLPRSGKMAVAKIGPHGTLNAILVIITYDLLVFSLVLLVMYGFFYSLGRYVIYPTLFPDAPATDGTMPSTLVAALMAAFAVLYLATYVTTQQRRTPFHAGPRKSLKQSIAVLRVYCWLRSDGGAAAGTGKSAEEPPQRSAHAEGLSERVVTPD
jgi:hypothetical protein